jgi:hypothetical protein
MNLDANMYDLTMIMIMNELMNDHARLCLRIRALGAIRQVQGME